MIKVGLLGCGTVGGGVVQLLNANAAYIEARVGAPIEIGRVLVRDPSKERVPQLDASKLTTDPKDVLDGSHDVIVEVMGGVDPARAHITTAIEGGKQVVTANKMLLALHGGELLDRARKRGVDLAFEGAVGGGIPVVRVLRDSLASDRIASLSGIINGTSNYVLTRMRQAGLSFDAAVRKRSRRATPRPIRRSTSAAETRRTSSSCSPCSRSARTSTACTCRRRASTPWSRSTALSPSDSGSS
jgi:homoserine dehydrogenase